MWPTIAADEITKKDIIAETIPIGVGITAGKVIPFGDVTSTDSGNTASSMNLPGNGIPAGNGIFTDNGTSTGKVTHPDNGIQLGSGIFPIHGNLFEDDTASVDRQALFNEQSGVDSVEGGEAALAGTKGDVSPAGELIPAVHASQQLNVTVQVSCCICCLVL